MKLLAAASAAPGFLQVVAMGLITVFVVLICLIILIKIMGALMAGSAKSTAPQPVPQPAPAPVPAVPQPNKQQLVAAISAAIAEDMGSGVNHIKIHSIRKL
ncbi:OadG family transporter subunit [Acutalibacter sp. 1XD8-33]|uniref:OadG family transporter subunit n=1 Tax=Acutalibacter sp. 1XD8-33 TaxID=2320081 RepID=UPI0013142D37|nr:OadG family transporter subunit [Acutalibacter sp. 1XD8-33]